MADGFLETRVRNFRTCTIEPQNDESGTCVMLDHTGNGSGRLKYDGDDKTDVEKLRCAIMGKETKVSIQERRYLYIGCYASTLRTWNI